MKQVLLVATGGAIGSVFRYLIQRLFLSFPLLSFPFGTLIVNIAGCFLIGLIWGLKEKTNLSEEFGLFMMTGICGGFTTFSAFSTESVALVSQQRFPAFVLYISISVVGGMVAAWLGHYLTK